MKRLILWDIDGTLIRSGSVGRRVIEHAAALTGRLSQVPSVVMSGKTDPQILREIFTAAALADDEIEGILPAAVAAAEAALAAAEHDLRAHGRVLPGVERLLRRLQETPGVRQTLLTGNLAPNAAVKVAAFGLTDFFDAEIGAYGSDHAEKMCLDRFAALAPCAHAERTGRRGRHAGRGGEPPRRGVGLRAGVVGGAGA